MKKTIKIEGMHCSHCSARVEKTLENLGIAAKVDLAGKCAVVEGKDIADSALREAVEDLGFEVISID